LSAEKLPSRSAIVQNNAKEVTRNSLRVQGEGGHHLQTGWSSMIKS